MLSVDSFSFRNTIRVSNSLDPILLGLICVQTLCKANCFSKCKYQPYVISTFFSWLCWPIIYNSEKEPLPTRMVKNPTTYRKLLALFDHYFIFQSISVIPILIHNASKVSDQTVLDMQADLYTMTYLHLGCER